MKFRLIEDQRETFPVRAMCDVLGVSPAGYYAWRSRPENHRKALNRALLAEIRRVHAAHRGRYGAPRVLPPPVRIHGFAVAMAWPPRSDADPAIHWLREQIRLLDSN